MSATPPDTRTSSTVSLADEDGVRRIVIDTLFGLWATVNNLSRLRPSRRERYRVTVFGSARTDPGHWVYQEVKRMSAALSAMGTRRSSLACTSSCSCPMRMSSRQAASARCSSR